MAESMRPGRGVQVSVGSEGLWRRFCEGFGLDSAVPGLDSNSERVFNRERTIAVVEVLFTDWDAEPLLARLAEVGIPAGKVRTMDEVYAWDQTASQGLMVNVKHSVLGRVTLPGPPLRFFTADGTEVTRKDHTAPPTLDEHADSVREWLQDAPSADPGSEPVA